jgi:site-specific recombinase XerD
MSDLGRVRVAGPLAAYVEGFSGELAEQGYTPGSAQHQLHLVAHLSRWLAGTGLTAGDLTQSRFEEFLRVRRADGYRRQLSKRAVAPLLKYLRGLGVTPSPSSTPTTPVQILIEDYRRYLVKERGLAAPTVGSYVAVASLFLSGYERAGKLELDCLSAADVSAFVVAECRRGRSRGAWASVLVTGLRSLLRFLFLEGHTTSQLASAVPPVTTWSGTLLPRTLSADVVAALLGSCDQRTIEGRRDHGILVMLARLGLRTGEVAALELDDVDWRAGELVVRGKGNRQERLPLPVDVGEALITYIHDGRPRVGCRFLFLRVRAPIVGLTNMGVGNVVARACRRAGVPRVNAHRLRHSAATAMLQGGASLADVGQVLRQARLVTTAMYAKVDRGALRSLALPWPRRAA